MDKVLKKALREKINAEVKSSPCHKRWINAITETTKAVYTPTFERYLVDLRQGNGQFSMYTPDELVEFQQNAVKMDRYLIVEGLMGYCKNLKVRNKYGEIIRDARKKTKNTARAVVASFFLHNYAELPRIPYRIKSETPPIRKLLTLTELRDVVISCIPLYQAIFLCMLMGGLGSHELVYWSKNGLSDLLRQREERKTVYKLEFPFGRKNSDTPFYSLIGGDGFRYLNRYLDVERPKTLKRLGIQSDMIFISKLGNQIKKGTIRAYWVNHLDKLGTITRLPVGGLSPVYERGLHQLRSLFRTQWHKTPADREVAEGLMGHEIDKNKYNQIMRDVPWVTREYRKALPSLNIMSSNKPFGLITEDEVKEYSSQEISDLQKQLDDINRRLKENDNNGSG